MAGLAAPCALEISALLIGSNLTCVGIVSNTWASGDTSSIVEEERGSTGDTVGIEGAVAGGTGIITFLAFTS